MLAFFQTIIYTPLYNALIFLTYISPWSDIGIAIVLLTLVVRGILFPFAHSSSKTQAKMRELEPVFKKIKEDHKDDQEAQARKMMELYKEHGLNPATGCLTLIVQLPIIIGLYWVFKDIHVRPDTIATIADSAQTIASSLLNTDIVYSFTPVPAFIQTHFLGIVDMTGKSITLALLAGVTQYIQSRLSMPGKTTLQSTGSLKDDMTQNLKFQMRYIFPFMVALLAYSISAAVALYWVTSNTFTVIHELFVRRKAKETINLTA
ncbi:MAG: membrane protein insertase YidC [Candidatus Yonathbacteria bacterium]|nr:membrane protein insertase YidC [Candidatus Yonathbacteria bacterium]